MKVVTITSCTVGESGAGHVAYIEGVSGKTHTGVFGLYGINSPFYVVQAAIHFVTRNEHMNPDEDVLHVAEWGPLPVPRKLWTRFME